MTAKRLASGGRIDRSQPLNYRWDDRQYSGFAGDTLASALLASGEQVLGRSFKYHRPRGVMSAGVEESGAIVTVGSGDRRDPNVPATTCELREGLAAYGQNAWPNVRFDVNALNGLFGRFFSAGFYYKTFMGLPPFEWGRGTGLWMQYEKLIRRAAGMGEASRAPDPDRYEHAHGFCDLLVVGSGPAGLHAALAAAEAGLDVWLVEQDFALGGDYLNQPNADPAELIAKAEAAGVRIMRRTTAFGLYDNLVTGLLERVSDHLPDPGSHLPRQRFWTLRPKAVVLASGALERHIAFGDNDRPGVMTANAARAYLNRYAVLTGERIFMATNNDSSYVTAAELARAGAMVTLMDARSDIPRTLRDPLADAGVELRCNCTAMRAIGKNGVERVVEALYDGGWQMGSSMPCDSLLVSGGWSPVVNLLSHRGSKPVWDAELACFVAGETSENIFMAGAAAAIWNTADCEASGRAAAAQAIAALGKQSDSVAMPARGGWQQPIQPLYEVSVPGEKMKCFVDPQHDVKADDVRLAHQEGFVSVEHLKRYTTLGMASDQGRMGNVIGLALMADALGREIPQVGTTTFRPPYTPVAIGALAGRNTGEHFRCLRRTPMHDWNLANGAVMTEAGLWQRPWYYPRAGEGIGEAYVREASTVRQTVGLCDVSSLGKIAVQGPDASTLLNRVYANAFAKLPVGKARYGVMLRDDGIVMDDGTTWRLSEDEFFMTTTTAQAAKVMVWLEELLETRWTDLRVQVSSVTDAWGGCAVAGPKSRECLAAVLEDAEAVSNEKLPFMGVIETTMKGGIPCRIARISFSGERAYEVYVGADYAGEMMNQLWASAQALGGCLYGLEALGTLRIEKGHVTAAELDGRVSIEDAGLGGMASTTKAYIGSSLKQRPELLREDRPRLVGIFPKDRSQRFNAGAILREMQELGGHGEGWITGVTHSPALGHWIGVGFASGGHEAWAGKTLIAADPVRKGNVEVELVSPHMFDPSGERMHG